jgi:hypothetical protein
MTKKKAPAKPKPKPKPIESGLTAALFEFQTRFDGVEKNRVNPFTGSQYASLDDVMVAARPLLKELNIAVIYTTDLFPMPNGEHVSVLSCRLVHLTSGEVMESKLPLPDISDGAQSVGSYMTYWRRYLFTGLANICEAADDDGNATMPAQPGATRMTEKQHSDILDFIEATGTKIGDVDAEGTLMHHINTTMNLTEIEQLSSRQASTILKMLKTKYKRQQDEKNG